MSTLPVHPFDEHLGRTLPASRSQRVWPPADGPLPALYLSHGAPPLFEDAEWMAQLFAWAAGSTTGPGCR